MYLNKVNYNDSILIYFYLNLKYIENYLPYVSFIRQQKSLC